MLFVYPCFIYVKLKKSSLTPICSLDPPAPLRVSEMVRGKTTFTATIWHRKGPAYIFSCNVKKGLIVCGHLGVQNSEKNESVRYSLRITAF